MINFINGEVVRVAENAMVILNNGIGWEINASNGTLADFSTIGDNVTVYTYMHVKEDGISLYGFSSLEEKEMFLRTVSAPNERETSDTDNAIICISSKKRA